MDPLPDTGAPDSGARWGAGSTVVVQEVWRGRLWSARPVTVVHDGGASVALGCPAGPRWKTATTPPTPPTRPRAATRAERFVASLSRCDWVLADCTWHVPTLCLAREGDWHAVRVAYEENGEHRGWYVNLQEPFRKPPRASRRWVSCSTSWSPRTVGGAGRTRTSWRHW